MSSTALRIAVFAFPRRWREVHAEEFLSTAARLHAERAHRSSVVTFANAVSGGLRLRLRTRPPVHRWALYRLQLVRLQPTWNDWQRDDLRGRWFAWRVASFHYWFAGIVLAAVEIGVNLYVDPRSFRMTSYPTTWMQWQVVFFIAFQVVLVPLALRTSGRVRRTHCTWARWEPDGSGPKRPPWGPPAVRCPDVPTT